MSYYGGWISPELLEQAMAMAQAQPQSPFSSTEQGLVTQELADQWTLVAQKYAGYFYGHPTRAGQYGTPEVGKVYIDYDKPWDEPLVWRDECDFCKATTRERVESRIAGYQESIEMEVRNGFAPTSLKLIDLPYYLKLRLCIEWNHLLRDFLAERPFLYYDLEERKLKAVVVEREQASGIDTAPEPFD